MVDFCAPPVLHDDVVTLRPHTLDDEAAVYRRSLDPATVEWTTIPQPYERNMAREYLEHVLSHKQPMLSWAIDVDRQMSGPIDLTFQDDTCSFGDLGFATNPDARGRGIMPRALTLVLRHAFEELDTASVRWRAYAGNRASWRVIEKCGFPPYSEIPDLIAQRGRRRDGWESTLTREAWGALAHP